MQGCLNFIFSEKQKTAYFQRKKDTSNRPLKNLKFDRSTFSCLNYIMSPCQTEMTVLKCKKLDKF